MGSIKYCELYEGKICNNCNECSICDLDPNKICDSCGKCIDEANSDYLEVLLDGILEDEDEVQDYSSGPDEVLTESRNEEDEFLDMEYLEDIPELKAEYDRRIREILKGEEVEEGHKHRH